MIVSKENSDTTLHLYANPLRIQAEALTRLQNHVLDGEEVVDGNNVFTFLLEFAASMTAGAAGEAINTFSSLYPSKAITSSDLYKHMSDFDYVNLFSTPASTKLTLMFERNFLINNAVQDSTNKSNYKIIIPSQSKFTIGTYEFGIHYPIEIIIKKNITPSGTVDYNSCTFTVLWKTDEYTPLHTLASNVLEHRFFTREGVTLFCIDIPVYQFSTRVYNETISPTAGFIRRYPFSDKFYAIRIFENSTGDWVEMHQTLSDTIYDINIPTAKVKVLTDSNLVEVVIPQVYINSGYIGSKILVKLYTCLGEMNVNISTYNEDQFITSFLVDDSTVNTGYSDMLKYINFVRIIPTVDTISGGKNGLSFDELRDRVIHDSTYDVIITPRDLSAYFADHGYSVSKYIDNITNRIFFAHKALVDSSGMLIGTGYYNTLFNNNILKITTDPITNEEYVDNYSHIKPVAKNTFMLLPTNVFKHNAAKDSMVVLNDDELNTLNTLTKANKVKELNNNLYSYSPFHTKVTTSPTPHCVTYDLLQPSISNMTFVGENPNVTSQLSVYTYAIEHLKNGSGGYNLYVNLYRTQDIATVPVLEKTVTKVVPNILVVLMASSQDGVQGYLIGEYIGISDNSALPVFKFHIDTDYRISESDQLCVTNFKNNTPVNIYLDMVTDLHVMTFMRTGILGPVATTGVSARNFPAETEGYTWLSTQSLTTKFGSRVDMLYNNISVVLGQELPVVNPTTTFATYNRPVYARYTEEDFLEEDPDTGEMIVSPENQVKIGLLKHPLELLHNTGDLILTESNGRMTPPTCKFYQDEQEGTIYISGSELDVVKGAYVLTTPKAVGTARVWKKMLSVTLNNYCTLSYIFGHYDYDPDLLNQWVIEEYRNGILHKVHYRTNDVSGSQTPLIPKWVMRDEPTANSTMQITFADVTVPRVYSLELQEPFTATSWQGNEWLHSRDHLYVYNCGLPLVNGRYYLGHNMFGGDRVWTKEITFENETIVHKIYYSPDISRWVLTETKSGTETSLFSVLDTNPNTDPWTGTWIADEAVNNPPPAFTVLNTDSSSYKITVEDMLEYMSNSIDDSYIFNTMEDVRKSIKHNEDTNVYSVSDPVTGMFIFLRTQDNLQAPSTILVEPYVNPEFDNITVGSGIGALYIRDFELEAFNPLKYLTHKQLMDLFELYDNPEFENITVDILSEKYKLPKYTISKILRWRTPWTKVLEASSMDAIREYINQRSIGNVPLADIRKLQNKMLSPIKQYQNKAEADADSNVKNGDVLWIEDASDIFDESVEPIFSSNYAVIYNSVLCIANVLSGIATTYTLMCRAPSLDYAKGDVLNHGSNSGLVYVIHKKLTDGPYTPMYISPLTESVSKIDLNMCNSPWSVVDKWPWDIRTWINTKTNLVDSKIQIELETETSSTIVAHGSGEALVEEGVVKDNSNTRSLIYNTSMLHIGYNLTISDELQHRNYRQMILDRLRHHFNTLSAARVSLLEQTGLFFKPTRTIGVGDFEHMGGKLSMRLDITMSLRLHVEARVIADAYTRETLEKNIYTIVVKHLSSGTISQASIAKDILATLGDSIVYVDVLGINEISDLQTLIPSDISFTPYIKQVLYIKDDGSIGTRSGIEIKWVVV